MPTQTGLLTMSESEPSSIPKFASFQSKPKPTSVKSDHAPRGPDRNRGSTSQRRHRTINIRSDQSPLSSTRDERQKGAEAPAASDPRPSEGVDKSAAFFVDIHGDRKNLGYGSLHRYDVSAYRRTGDGRLIGASSASRIDQQQSNEKEAVISREDQSARKPRKRLLTAKQSGQAQRVVRIRAPRLENDVLNLEFDFVALRSAHKRKQGSQSPRVSSCKSDYRSIEERSMAKDAMTDEAADLDTATDDDDDVDHASGAQIRHENAILTQKAKLQPTDVDAWLALIEHQAKMIFTDPDVSHATARSKRALADIRLAIYDQALRHITLGQPGNARLLLGMLEEGALVWESSKLVNKWRGILEANPGSVELWVKYLDFVQSSHTGFRFENCKAAYVQCLWVSHNALSSLHGEQSSAIATVWMYVFLRFTAFVRDAGYDELAIAFWQILLEWTYCKPPEFDDGAQSLEVLEEFWESDMPRIGEENALGWSAYVQHKTDLARQSREVGERALDACRPWQDFADREARHNGAIQFPAAADDESAANDPYRSVLYSDLREVAETMPVSLPHAMVADAFLAFMRFRSLPETNCSMGFQNCQTDAYLRTDAVYAPRDRSTLQIISNYKQTTYSLFQEQPSSTQSTKVPDVPKNISRPEFVSRVLDRLVAARLGDDRLAEYYLALKTHWQPADTARIAKRLLKARPSSLRLYNAYALSEARFGHLEKARNVWSAAAAAQNTFSILLRHSRMLSEVESSNDNEALACLLGTSVTSNQVASTSTVLPIDKLRATQEFQQGWAESLDAQNYVSAVQYAECSAMLTYLTNDFVLEPVMVVYEHWSSVLLARSANGAAETLHQAKASLLNVHLKRKRPYKPAYMKTELVKSLKLFPSNSIILEMYAQIQATFQLDDRLRVTLQDNMMISSESTLTQWSFVLTEELRRCTAEVSGSTENTIRSTFAQALLGLDSAVRHSPLLWTWWFRFEYPDRYLSMDPPKLLTVPERAQALRRAKQVFLDGLRHLPWYKPWVIMGIRSFAENGDMKGYELRQLYDVLGERELRIRTPVEMVEHALSRPSP